MWRSLPAIALLALTGCNPPGASTNTQDMEVANLLAEANRALEDLERATGEASESTNQAGSGQGWSYFDESDPMNDRKTEFACIRSNNAVQLGFPYGSPHGRLCLRDSPQFGRDAYVELEGEGQILCYSYRSCTVRIRFDTSEARNFSAVGPSDNSTNIVFIEGRDRLERELKSAERTAIQIEFYRAGQQTFIFPTAGFDWDGHRER